jgi:hypothetical protein
MFIKKFENLFSPSYLWYPPKDFSGLVVFAYVHWPINPKYTMLHVTHYVPIFYTEYLSSNRSRKYGNGLLLI